MLISRIRLAPGARGAARVPDLADAYDGHQFLWRFFGDDATRRRDFVFRADLRPHGPVFHVVSERSPGSADATWSVETKPYDIKLPAGTRLGFSLRANPTQRDRSGGSADNTRHDVVMVAKRKLRASGREEPPTATLVHEAGIAWLAARAERSGFRIVPDHVRAEGYRQWRFRKRAGGVEVHVSSIDYEGLLEVTDPAEFQKSLHTGVGPAKGFGFGLLLVRRA